jgi:ditrans,polycis-polyprenyl diphosphate synthase
LYSEMRVCRLIQGIVSHRIHEMGIRIRVLGNLDLLPPHVKKAAIHCMQSTRYNTRGTLNICCPYTSRHEIVSTIELLADALENKRLEQDDVDMELFEKCLFTEDDPFPDVLIRTSGESRLSDFLLWQVRKTMFITFTHFLV